MSRPLGLRAAALAALLVTSGAAGAVDPWLRPGHLRAVAAPPSTWRDLAASKRPIRLWWDTACHDPDLGPAKDPQAWRAWSGETCARATVEQERGRRWVVVAQDVEPGWTSRPVGDRTRFRLRLHTETLVGRVSEPVAAPPWHSPTDLARVGVSDGALLGARVGQVRADLSSGEVWLSTLGGGAARLSPDGTRARALTRWEGLPDDRVVAVDHQGERLLLGTGAGAALALDERVVAVWDQSLPDPWVQSVLLDERALWLGTYRGLSRITPTDARIPLSPWSVFSLARARGGGVWVGYDGLARLDAEGIAMPPPLPAAPPPANESRRVSAETEDPQPLSRLRGEHLFDLLETDQGVLAASQESGLRRLPLQPLAPPDEPQRSEQAYGVAQTQGGVWLARGPGGLEAPDGRRLGRAQGLPSDTVWSVADAGAGVWAGTAQGLARVLPARGPSASPRTAVLPLAAWPADSPASSLLPTRRGLWVAGAAGLTHVGRPHRFAGDLAIGARQPVVALLDDHRGGAWAIGEAAVHLDRRGRLSLVELPARPRAATLHQDVLWVATASGLWRQGEDGGLGLVSELPGVRRLASGPRALWAVAERRVVRVLAGATRPFLQTHPVLDLAPDPAVEGEIWVGTENGLERLLTRGEREGEVVDVLGDADQGVVVPAVAADGRGGCWMAASDGTVARVDRAGRRAWTRLADNDPPWPVALVLDPQGGGDVAWVLTERGTWRVRLPLDDALPP